MLKYLGFALVTFLPSSALCDPLYKIYGPRGSVTFTSRTPPAGSKFDVLSAKAPNFSMVFTGSRYRYRAMRSKFDEIIRNQASEQSLDPALVKAVVHAESMFDPGATSNKGAMGLMQLMPATARRMGVNDAYHPEQNIAGGTKYLRWLVDRYEGNLRLAVAAYNAGEGAVDEFKGVPPYSETVNYVKRVMTLLALYRAKNTSSTPSREKQIGTRGNAGKQDDREGTNGTRSPEHRHS